MARDKYALLPLLRARRISADKATLALRVAENDRRNASEIKARAQADIERAESAARKIRDEGRPASCAISAADLAVLDAWETREQKERAERSSRLRAAEDRERREAEREHALRAALEKSAAEARVVEKDREKWHAREARREELLQEDRANEAWAKRTE